jgi:hypothetical protein
VQFAVRIVQLADFQAPVVANEEEERSKSAPGEQREARRSSDAISQS